MRYEDFSLTLESPQNGSHPVLVHSPAGSGRGTFEVPFTPDELARLDAPASGETPRDTRPSVPVSRDPARIGDRLFQALFTGAVRDLFERSLGRSEGDPDLGLRIVLRFDPGQPGVASLTTLPWELLYRQDRREFLNFSRKSPLVRALDVPRPLPPPSGSPLRVLIVIANPPKSTPLATGSELQSLQEALASAPGVSSAILPHATPEALRARLLAEPFHVLHFIGHGSFDAASGEGFLLLEDGRGGARLVSGAMLADILRDFWALRLVFVNACRTARASAVFDPFAGLTAALVMAGVPAVLGMQLPISDPAAIAFSSAFYQRLAAGDPIAAATVEGRMAIHLRDAGSQEWATPVLFLRSQDGRLFDPPPTPSQPGISPEIRAGIIDDSRYIAEKTAGFVGRKWLFDAIAEFTRTQPRGYFILRGDPGIGKSAFLAQMAKREGTIHHFNVRAEGIRSPERFLANICSQLIATYELDAKFLPPEATRDSRFLNSLLDKVASRLRPGEKAVILVDALDEADPDTLTPGANPLYLPTILPPGVFMIVTTRREALGLRIECEEQTLDIEQDSQGNVADVREFVESRLAAEGVRAYIAAQKLDAATFVEEMVARSQGNFMYLRYVLPQIESGVYTNRDLRSLPVGLQNYYEDHWRRMRSRDETDWFDDQLPVLVALTAVREPVSIGLLADFSKIADVRRIRRVLQEWDQFLYTAQTPGGDEQPRKRFRLYHASFHDFITAKDEIGDERVHLKQVHADIAGALLRETYD
jgi:mRNA-degrading endonuclease toxin of MazEF toxin-antitoxin module